MKNYIAIDRAIDSLLQKTADPGALRPSGAGGVKRRDNDRGGNHAAHGEFVAAAEDGVGECAQRHFENVGMKSRRMNKPETLELAKPAETTYFGVQIAFAQDLVRYARRVGADYEEAINFFEEVKILPGTRYLPWIIGGHCGIPNIQLLCKLADSPLLDGILESNSLRVRELQPPGNATRRRKVSQTRVP
jgi:hypothetical protein